MKDVELNKGNESSRFPVLKSQKVGDCFIRVTLDTRMLPVRVSFQWLSASISRVRNGIIIWI